MDFRIEDSETQTDDESCETVQPLTVNERSEMNSRVGLAAALIAILCISVGKVRGVDPPGKWSGDLSPISNADWNYERAAHLLERAGFGGPPEEIARLAAMTPDAAVDYLVDYESIDVSGLPAFVESNIYPNDHKYVHISKTAPIARETNRAYGIPATRPGSLPLQPAFDEYYTMMWCDFLEIARAGQWWAERMLITPRPFQERMTLFWHDHFATSQEKVHRHRMMLNQIDLLRQNAVGNFGDILVKISQDPAMLIWLDNKDNLKDHPNENFAREVMELFTMGEGQGYTESDIREMARAFTGWTLTDDITTAPDQGQFIDDPELHDRGEKSFLGRTGRFNGYDTIQIILKQDRPAEFVTNKLYRYFVSEEIDAAINKQLAKKFRDQKYELKPLMKTIFMSKDFYSQKSVGTQIKSPVQLIVSTYRKLGLRSVPGLPDFDETSTGLGQALMMPPNVAGWSAHRSWINPATLLARGNFVHTLLFPPDPADLEPVDKDIHEGFRHIPIKFSDYGVVPHIWSSETRRMEPVSLAVYDQYLTGLNFNDAIALQKKGDAMSDEAMMERLTASRGETKSKLGEVARNEQYNLGVGIYNGHVEANQRVLPIPRTVAKIDLVAMIAEARLTGTSDVAEYFQRRFLRVPLHQDRKDAIDGFAQEVLGDSEIDFDSKRLEQSLREILHLVLSAPEYQLS